MNYSLVLLSFSSAERNYFHVNIFYSFYFYFFYFPSKLECLISLNVVPIFNCNKKWDAHLTNCDGCVLDDCVSRLVMSFIVSCKRCCQITPCYIQEALAAWIQSRISVLIYSVTFVLYFFCSWKLYVEYHIRIIRIFIIQAWFFLIY